MKYREYKAHLCGKDLRLGFLGEYHLYSPKDIKRASKILENYSNLASEGSEQLILSDYKTSWIDKLDSFFYGLDDYFESLVTNRSSNNEDALSLFCHRDDSSKRLFFLEGDYDEVYSFSQNVASIMSSVFSISANLYLYCKGKILRKELKIDYDVDSGSFIYELLDGFSSLFVDYISDDEQREKNMAVRLYAIMMDNDLDNLLVVCGEDHIGGIVKYLEEYESVNLENVGKKKKSPKKLKK